MRKDSSRLSIPTTKLDLRVVVVSKVPHRHSLHELCHHLLVLVYEQSAHPVQLILQQLSTVRCLQQVSRAAIFTIVFQ